MPEQKGQKYQNRDSVVITAVQISDPTDEHYGFWLTTDKNGVQGRVPDDVFKQVFTEIKGK